MDQELVMQYEFVRRSGQVNMLDRYAVMMLANGHGLDKLAKVAGESLAYATLLREFRRPTDVEYRKWLDSLVTA